jgi:hypothetical protein
MKRCFQSLALLAVAAVTTVSSTASAQAMYDECGQFIQGVSCKLFADNNGRVWLLDIDVSSFAIGVDFQVSGLATLGCPTLCLQGDGCINMSAVTTCGGPPPTHPDFCSGDGGDQMGCTDCPCGNNAAPGTVGGCLNSAGTATRLNGSGFTSVSAPPGDPTDLRFGAEGAPPFAFCVLNSGDVLAPTNPMNPCFGFDTGILSSSFDGLRCVVQNTRRHGGRSADANGEIGVTNNPWGGEGPPAIGLGQAFGGFMAGQTSYFQITHREDPLLICMRGLNTSQAVQVNFTP